MVVEGGGVVWKKIRGLLNLSANTPYDILILINTHYTADPYTLSHLVLVSRKRKSPSCIAFDLSLDIYVVLYYCTIVTTSEMRFRRDFFILNPAQVQIKSLAYFL